MSRTYSVLPMRFSANPGAVIAFLETLGLHKQMDQESGGWAVFAGASGAVAVHGTETAASGPAAGDTSLNFTVADVAAAGDELRTVGLTTTVWDETYGKQGSVRTPIGCSIGLSEHGRTDLPGSYRVHEQVTAASLDVVVVWYSADFRRDAAFFAAFGFEPFDSLDNPWWCTLRAGRGQGVIGLHAVDTEADPGIPPVEALVGRPALVRVGYETSEPLDALAARLRAAGHDSASVIDDEVGTRVVMNDPDGQRLEIFPTT